MYGADGARSTIIGTRNAFLQDQLAEFAGQCQLRMAAQRPCTRGVRPSTQGANTSVSATGPGVGTDLLGSEESVIDLHPASKAVSSIKPGSCDDVRGPALYHESERSIAVFSHAWSPNGSMLLACGGPVGIFARGSYLGLWL